jgi:hypothetical protein
VRDILKASYYRWFEMAVPIEEKRILMGESPDCLGVVRCCDELAASLKGFTKCNDKMSNLRRSKVIVRLIPKTKQRAVGFIRGEHECGNDEAFLTV